MEGTGSSPFFENNALELARRLEPCTDAEARALKAEAQKLVEEFRAWARNRPTGEDRVARINELFELYRRVSEFLASRLPPSNRPGP